MLSNLDQNIFFWDASAETFTEVTKELNDYRSGFKTFTFETGDRLYFATTLPFNHRYFGFTQLNSNASADLIVEYYTGAGWKNPSRILDYTESQAGASFGVPGIMQFIPNDEYMITQVSDTKYIQDDNFKDHAPAVYNMFWQGIGFSETVTIGLSYAGQLFVGDDEDIYSEYPLLNEPRYLEQWEAGKEDWEEQRVIATNRIIRELERRAIIVDRNQILDTARLYDAAIHLTAIIIFSGLGVERFEKEIKEANNKYTLAMNMDRYNVDRNANAMLDGYDRSVRVSLRRR